MKESVRNLLSQFSAFGSIFSSLQSKNYRIYFGGQSVSLIGTWMQNIAMSWLVYRLTGSVFLLGVVAFTSQVPSFVLSPFAGVLTDKFNRHRIMILTQVLFMIQALVLAVLVLTNTILVWHIIALSLFFGFITAFDTPARQSLVIDLIDNPENLGNAIALNSAMFNGARLIGPGIAGITIAIVGEGICFLINAISFLAVIIALLKLNIIPKIRENKVDNLRESLKEGFNYTFGFAPIKVLIILLGIISLVGLPYIVLMPAYAKEIMHGGSDTLGFLMSAAGAGALLGALILAARKTVLGLGKLISYSTLFFGLSVIVISFSHSHMLSYIVLFVLGYTMITSIASVNTLIQTLADEDKRGRVMSFYAMALLGMNPIGNLIAGSVASAIGISLTLLSGGIITAISALWFEYHRPSLRKYTHPIYVQKGIIKEIAVGIQTANTLHKKIE